MSKDFWNLPVNPVWRVPGFMKEGKADNEHSNPVLLPLVPEFTNICISHLQFLHFQKFLLEVVAIGRKNAGWEYDSQFKLFFDKKTSKRQEKMRGKVSGHG